MLGLPHVTHSCFQDFLTGVLLRTLADISYSIRSMLSHAWFYLEARSYPQWPSGFCDNVPCHSQRCLKCLLLEHPGNDEFAHVVTVVNFSMNRCCWVTIARNSPHSWCLWATAAFSSALAICINCSSPWCAAEYPVHCHCHRRSAPVRHQWRHQTSGPQFPGQPRHRCIRLSWQPRWLHERKYMDIFFMWFGIQQLFTNSHVGFEGLIQWVLAAFRQNYCRVCISCKRICPLVKPRQCDHMLCSSYEEKQLTGLSSELLQHRVH